MRSTWAWVAILAVVGTGTGIFCWQRGEIVGLRAQLSRQGVALENNRRDTEDFSRLLAGAKLTGATSASVRGLNDNSAVRRADERQVILDQYRDVLAQMNLPPETAARLEDLLTDRVESVLDAEDAAMQQGFAAGSAETARVVALSIAEIDRQIADLVGTRGNRQLDGLPADSPQPAMVTEPAPPVSVVNVVVQNPPAPYYGDTSASSQAPDTPAAYTTYPYYTYPYYPVAAVLIGRGEVRPSHFRSGISRSYPSGFRGTGARIVSRAR